MHTRLNSLDSISIDFLKTHETKIILVELKFYTRVCTTCEKDRKFLEIMASWKLITVIN